jgi:2-oxoglutarate dehydrogenase E1 component
MLDRLAWSEMFENFLSTKYTAAKRFGLEGGETLIPGMKALIDRAADLGVESVTIGMPHRGRLNVLGNVVRKPLEQIFSEFQGGVKPSKEGGYTGSGDVKYHLGTFAPIELSGLSASPPLLSGQIRSVSGFEDRDKST